MVTFLDIKFDSIPLKNVYFLVFLSLPTIYNVIFFINILNLLWRYQSISIIMKDEGSITRWKLIMIIYEKLNVTIASINRYFMFNMVFSLFNVWIILITTVFLIYDIIIHSLLLDNFILIAGSSFYIITSGLISLMTVSYSSRIADLNERIVQNINQIKMKMNDRKLQQFTELAILQVENTKIEISGGIFVLNWKVIFIMISSFISYFFVLLQFDIML